MGTLHCALENGADLYVNERNRRYDTIALGLLKKEEELEERRMPNCYFYCAHIKLRVGGV